MLREYFAVFRMFYLFFVVLRVRCRAVVKSTFVESKTSPSPKRFESESRPSPKRFESKEVRGQVQVQMRRSKQRKKKIIFKTTYLIIDNLCDTRDGISSILIK